jgi:hypothetical protein
MLGKNRKPDPYPDVSQVRPWKLTPEAGVEAAAVWPGPEGALVDWMLFPGPPEEARIRLFFRDAIVFFTSKNMMQKIVEKIILFSKLSRVFCCYFFSACRQQIASHSAS